HRMKIPFKSDPSATLDRTRRKLEDVKANLLQLEAKRKDVLLNSEVEEVAALDQAITAEQRVIELYQDKIKLIEEEVRRVRYHEKEKQRAVAIEQIAAKFEQRAKIADELQKTIQKVSELYLELTEPAQLEQLWPFPSPFAGFGRLDLKKINRETA